MTTPFKRSGVRGFTLIELLIVVIIVAILAAIAIPQFSSSTTDAQAAALDADLASVRTAIEQYKVQHNSVYPGDLTSTGACTSGANKAGAAGTSDALVAQLQYYSNAAGVVCDTPSADFKFGPYLRRGMPSDPIKNNATVVMTTTGSPIVVAANVTAGGWAYDTKSGQFVMNSGANDTGNPARAYYLH